MAALVGGFAGSLCDGSAVTEDRQGGSVSRREELQIVVRVKIHGIQISLINLIGVGQKDVRARELAAQHVKSYRFRNLGVHDFDLKWLLTLGSGRWSGQSTAPSTSSASSR